MAVLDWLPRALRNDAARAVSRGAAAALVLAVALLLLDDASLEDALVMGAVFAAGYLLIHAAFRRL